MPHNRRSPKSPAAQTTTTTTSCSRSTKLYDLLGVDPSCSSSEIIRGYRLRALQLHPDKNKDSDAHNRFIQVKQAYEILKDEKKRKRYNETGCEEEDSVEFEEAYDWFRCNAPKVEEADIEAFCKEYRDSDMEEEDLVNLYEKQGGDIRLLLEYIPYSEPEDVDRFLKIFEKLFKKNSLEETEKYRPSIEALRKHAAKYKRRVEKEREECERLQKEHREGKKNSSRAAAPQSLADLTSAIQSNASKRAAAATGWLDALEGKYKPKNKKSKEEESALPTEKEFQDAQKLIDLRAKSNTKAATSGRGSNKGRSATGDGSKSESITTTTTTGSGSSKTKTK
eukprot:GHVS01029464.1.p1 GENE.GHVS01029464.1~~GHVS01029464.1.p1  ORF type:complete len:338 (-),score=81.17 GHVS01029464.1:202-1215(-)